MAGRIIGLIPLNFIIVLLENHVFYDEERSAKKTGHLSMHYRTAMTRQESIARLSGNGGDDSMAD